MRLDARVNEREALGYLGYAGQPLDADLPRRLAAAVEACASLCPQGAARAFPIAPEPPDERDGACGIALVGTPLVLPGRDIAAHLAGAREAVLMVVTLGLRSEAQLRRASATSAVDGLLLDACASSLVESAADALCERIERWAHERGCALGARFSPGYGDLPLAVQGALVETVGAGRALGVTVTDADLLVPTKSITAVAGLFDAPEAPERGERACRLARPAPDERGACAACRLSATCPIHARGEICHDR